MCASDLYEPFPMAERLTVLTLACASPARDRKLDETEAFQVVSNTESKVAKTAHNPECRCCDNSREPFRREAGVSLEAVFRDTSKFKGGKTWPETVPVFQFL